jgi:diguanylate cyclase (GGDEF)-like protein
MNVKPPSRRVLDWLKTCREENDSVAQEFARENLRRLRLAAGVILLLNLVHLLVFGGRPVSADAVQERWRLAIFFMHAVMALWVIALGLLAHWRLGRPPQRRTDQWLGSAGMVCLVLFAGAFAVVDQWVTSAITPFVIGSTAASIVFLIRPVQALALFGSAAAGVIAALPLTQTHPMVLLSNQVNALTAVVLAIFLAILLWRKNTRNVLLQRALHLSHTALEQKQVELEFLARNDPLTGLYNRREFTRLAELELARAARQGTPTALVMADLDEFKRVNDTYGHPVGDEVLKNTARILMAGVRQSDVVARVGGEEIMLLLPCTDQPAALVLANRLREALVQAPLHWNGQRITVTASLGITVVPPGRADALEPAYIAVDEALYQAKHLGRNRVECAALRSAGGAGELSAGTDSG